MEDLSLLNKDSTTNQSIAINTNDYTITDIYGNETIISYDGNIQYKQAAPTYDQLYRFKQYWDDLYGQGLDIANWHLNGTLEPYDNFYESALDYSGVSNTPPGQNCK